MAITTYTTYDTIRALLGVGSKEVKDATLALPTYELQFLLELGDIDNGVGAAKAEADRIVALGAGAATANDTAFMNLVNLFAGFSVAKQLLGSVALFAPMKITDGSALVQRDKDPYTKLIDAVNAGYITVRTRLTAALLVQVPTANVIPVAARSYISSVGIASDPVTGV